MASEPQTLDPLDIATTADSRSILYNVYEGLVKPDTTGSLVPALAESFDMDETGVSYSFLLRDGLLFHDKSRVKAEDVEFTFSAAKEKKYAGFDAIEKIEVLGDREIKIILKKPDPEFLPYLTLGIVPKANSNREGNPIGAGPYKIESYTPQQSLVLVKNPFYYNANIPKVEKITIVFLASSGALQMGLKGGNINSATITSDIMEQLDISAFQAVMGYSNMVQGLFLNNAVKPFDNIKVRQAVNYAVNIDGIIDAAFYGRGTPSGSALVPSLKNAYEDSLGKDPYPADLEKAKALLAEAGYPNGFDMEILVSSNYSMHVDTAQVLVNQLAGAGIRAKVQLVEWLTWLSDVYRNRKFQATIISFDGSSVPLSPRSFLGRYVSTASGNLINFNSGEYDAVYQEALTETDGVKRAGLYKKAQRILSENAASVFIQDIVSYKIFPKGFTGILNYPMNVMDFASLSYSE
jgi:peptide/nickel transport system substrate-binding protein